MPRVDRAELKLNRTNSCELLAVDHAIQHPGLFGAGNAAGSMGTERSQACEHSVCMSPAAFTWTLALTALTCAAGLVVWYEHDSMAQVHERSKEKKEGGRDACGGVVC
jgi:hypothetical protein